jgi:hypothetical protein
MKRIRDTFLIPIEQLEQALTADVPGREGPWAEGAGRALEGVLHALRQHIMNAESPGGMFGEVDLTRPTLARQVGGLRQEHTRLLEEGEGLLRDVHAAAQAFGPTAEPADPLPPPAQAQTVTDFGAIRQRGEQFLTALRQHRDQENGLVQESVTTDIGAGD